jgi:TATA-box binding protein (TBP) (component of TFIID and TFIIIB)
MNELNEYKEINQTYKNYIDYTQFNMGLIPQNVSISTMSYSCHLGTLFKLENIYNHMLLNTDDIIIIKSGKGMRCCPGFETKFKSTNKNKNKNFYNQYTIIMKVREDVHINIKLFKNGSIQMTGVKEITDTNIAINKLINRLKEVFVLANEEITFVENPDNLAITRFNTDLINSDFGVKYLINRDQLYQLLIKNNILCRISSIHACVNIKYKIGTIDNIIVYVSIFVFQTGKIIIIAKKSAYIKSAYYYIVRFLNEHKLTIMKKDINSILNDEELRKYK